MCGIAGFYSLNNRFSESMLREMTDLLSHRGPDSEGYYLSNGIGMGHKRLSILDLSDKGRQPMISHCGRYVMVYNGEVYNYREVAAELQENNFGSIQFSSSSDSEVLLEAFAKWGKDFVHKLNGMFAISIYDKQLKELWLFRDRIGIKPLFYSHIDGDLLFASELKSIKNVITTKLTIRKQSFSNFLHFGFISAPNTIYNEVKKLEPGYYLRMSEKGGVELKQYWSVYHSISGQCITREKEAIVKISDMLATSVQYQLNSDVPFGIFLSGGIDSSLIAAISSSMSTTTVNTFSIGFRENEVNESDHARKIAAYLKTNHNEFIVSHNDAIDLVEKLIDVYDEPFADSSAIPTMLVSRLAKKHVTVALSGEGGDELFFGYGTYKWAKRLSNPLLYNMRGIIKTLLKQTNNGRLRRGAKVFDIENKEDFYSHIFSQEQYLFSKRELDNLLNDNHAVESFYWQLRRKELPRKLKPMEIQALFDIIYYLPGDLLTKVDRASMQYSLETRVPYLDHRLVEMAVNISSDLKYRSGISKYILKEILYQYIPKSYFDRPKQGFAIPLIKWLKHELRYLIDDYLNADVISRYNVVDAEKVEELKKRFLSGDDYLFNRIWVLIILHKWLSKNA